MPNEAMPKPIAERAQPVEAFDLTLILLLPQFLHTIIV